MFIESFGRNLMFSNNGSKARIVETLEMRRMFAGGFSVTYPYPGVKVIEFNGTSRQDDINVTLLPTTFDGGGNQIIRMKGTLTGKVHKLRLVSAPGDYVTEIHVNGRAHNDDIETNNLDDPGANKPWFSTNGDGGKDLMISHGYLTFMNGNESSDLLIGHTETEPDNIHSRFAFLMNGGSGNDIIEGSAFSDFIIAEDGADKVNAGDGDDSIFIRDADTVFGGFGNDRFYIAVGESSGPYVNGESGFDTMIGMTDDPDVDIQYAFQGITRESIEAYELQPFMG